MAYNNENNEVDNEGTEDIAFLSIDEVKQLHEEGIRTYSPGESTVVLDHGLLESAVQTPGQTWDGEYVYPTITEMAAAYLIGLACNHAFENGNKRIGFAACSTFLRMNGYRLTLNQDEATDMTLGVVTHELTREDLIEILENAIDAL